MLADQSIGYIGAMEVAAVAGNTEPEPAGWLTAKPKQRQSAEVAKQTVNAHLLGIIPEVRYPEVPCRRLRSLGDCGADAFRPGIFQDFITVNPQYPLWILERDLFQQKVSVTSFIKSLEGRWKDRHRIAKRLADEHCIVGGMIIEYESVPAQPQCLGQYFTNVLAFILDPQRADHAGIADSGGRLGGWLGRRLVAIPAPLPQRALRIILGPAALPSPRNIFVGIHCPWVKGYAV